MIPFQPHPCWYRTFWLEAIGSAASDPAAPVRPAPHRKEPAMTFVTMPRGRARRSLGPISDLGLAALILILGLALAGIAATTMPLDPATASASASATVD
jgi:hypothetical protein